MPSITITERQDEPRGALYMDIYYAVSITLRGSRHQLINAWVYVPIGILVILYACLGVNSLVGLGHVTFPSSVAVMILLFVMLLMLDWMIGERRTKSIVKLVEVPGGFALRYINCLFCPGFVLIPLAPPISSVEVGKIILVFVFGYVLVFGFTAFFTRGLLRVFAISKRATTERAEELGSRRESIPLSQMEVVPEAPPFVDSRASSVVPLLHEQPPIDLKRPLQTQDPTLILGSGGPPVDEGCRLIEAAETPPPQRHSAVRTRGERWAALVMASFDLYTYAFLFFAVGLPIYFLTDYAMPAQLTLNVLCYFGALALPAHWRRVCHPALVASILMIVGIYILAMCHGWEFDVGLRQYQTKTTYLHILSGQVRQRSLPGAGDVLGSVLQVSIVALALPMYQNRRELKRSFFPIAIPSISLSVASLFGYPAVCHAIGISPSRSLAFSSRSLTLALALPATANLDGDMSAIAVFTVLSGIVGVVIGPQLLDVFHVPEDDYITRGVTLGVNSAAIATALLLVTDPRAAAFSSLAMGLFGTVTVGFTSVPAIAHAVQKLAGK